MGSCLAPCLPRRQSALETRRQSALETIQRAKKKHKSRSLAAVQSDLHEAITCCRDPWALEQALQIVRDSAGVGASAPSGAVDASPWRGLARGNSVIEALSKIKELPGTIGLDIGGTLAKMVYLQGTDEEPLLAERFGKSGRRHSELAFQVSHDGNAPVCRIHCVSGETDRLRKALENASHGEADCGDLRKIVVSGGGAHRFAGAFQALLNIEFVPFQEMESLVRGLEFLHENMSDGEVFMLGENGEELPAEWPEPFFPYLMVNMGSGVSMLRIDGRDEASGKIRYTRLGGTACGGATFLGLVRLVADADSFEQALELVGRGDPTRANTLVKDIYGVGGCATLGLPPNMTAAYFGKLMNLKGRVWDEVAKADLAAALMMLVVQESVVLSRALSLLIEEQCGHPPPVFFVGGFLANNTFAQRVISRSYWNLKLGPALFLRHADFLGALGALAHALDHDVSDA